MSSSSPYQPPASPVGYRQAPTPQLKELKTARVLLVILGILYGAILGFQWNSAQKEINAAEERLAKQGMTLEDALAADPEAASQYKLGKILVFVGIGVAVAFIVLGFLVFKFPVGAPLTGLILYGVDQISGMAMDQTMIYKGLLIKILIIAGLVKAVKAGRNWKNSQLTMG